LLDSQLELDVIPESNEVDEMFQFDIESESEVEDNSSACIVAAVDERIVTPATTNGINGTNEYVVAPDVRQVVGIDKPSVSREDQLLIRLSALCTDANVPLYLVDDIVEIILDETDCGLVLNSSHFSKWRSFLPQLSTIFPSPKLQSHHIGIEGNYKLDQEYQHGICDSVSIVCYDFLQQVNDLLNDATLFGNIANFASTIDTADPFSNKQAPAGGLVDEVNDGKWFQETLQQCDIAANGEPYMLLPVIGYVDKTGTDVKTRGTSWNHFHSPCRS